MLNKIIALFFMSVLVSAVYANDYDLINLKQRGIVGEQANGYLSIVNKNNGYESIQNKINRADDYIRIQKEIDKINKQRKAYYDETAKQKGAKRYQIESIFGKKLLEKTKKEGGYIKNKKGKWQSYGFD